MHGGGEEGRRRLNSLRIKSVYNDKSYMTHPCFSDLPNFSQFFSLRLYFKNRIEFFEKQTDYVEKCLLHDHRKYDMMIQRELKDIPKNMNCDNKKVNDLILMIFFY